MSLGVTLRALVVLWGILRRRLGTPKALRLTGGMLLDLLIRNPWRGMEKPKNRKETISRRVLTPLVHLYRRLRQETDSRESLALMEGIILKTTILFMRKKIPVIRPGTIKQMSPSGRRGYLVNIARRFFNAEMENIEVSETFFKYDINRCYFARWLPRCGHPELAPFFCRGDFEYFSRIQPHIRLERTHTLAIDQQNCDFKFTLRED